jgi:hypothetical protein
MFRANEVKDRGRDETENARRDVNLGGELFRHVTNRESGSSLFCRVVSGFIWICIIRVCDSIIFSICCF